MKIEYNKKLILIDINKSKIEMTIYQVNLIHYNLHVEKTYCNQYT